MTASRTTRERVRSAAPADDAGDDVVGILLSQHVAIRDLFERVRSARGAHRQQSFDALRRLLVAHETGEEIVLRPVTRTVAGAAVADARNHEEKSANRELAALERLDVSSSAFEARFAGLERSVLAHAAWEEAEEFPALRALRPDRDLARLGRHLRSIQAIAPTHAHPRVAGSPTAQRLLGPMASLLDRVQDARR